MSKKKETSFRDQPLNIDKKGHRKWVYAKKPKGKWYKRRTIVSVVLLLFFILAPIIEIGGNPFMLLDIENRKFIIFGVIFWAQDTLILAFLMLTFVFFILLFTVTFGRIWCGWLCPQTIFLEMVFRKIEFWIEGTVSQRKKLDKAPWTKEKIFKKTSKHAIFVILSVLMTNMFLQWFIGPEKLIEIVTGSISEHSVGFMIMIGISALFYWIYAFLREQICTLLCPYGRMQGVLLDKKSITVAYDYKRGEPRGAKSKGDCISCNRCVSVCPTGIDIKDGTQLECINCTACIDECDSVMESIKKPAGLIRYESIQGIETKSKSIWNPRNKAYTAVLLLILGASIYMLVSRPAVETSIMRTPGSLFKQPTENTVSNTYNISVMNKSHKEMVLSLKLLSHEGKIQMAGKEIRVKDQNKFQSIFILTLEKGELSDSRTEIMLGVFEKDKLIDKVEVNFISPK